MKNSAAPATHTPIIALDLGTNTGWATRSPDGTISAGLLKTRGGSKHHPGQRFLDFEAAITDMIVQFQGATGHIDGSARPILAHEDVVAHRGVIAAHIYGGFEAMVSVLALKHGWDLKPIPVCTINMA